jgi:hypothetical protein
MRIIWALARNTIHQAVRLKAATVLIVVFFVATPLLLFKVNTGAQDLETTRLFYVEADGTQTGEVQVLLTYSVTIAMVLLSALTCLLSARVLDQEIVGKQIFLLAAKPVRRWQMMLGKWLGILLLDAWLLLIFGVTIVGMAAYLAQPDPARPDGYNEVRREVLTCRRGVRPLALDRETYMRDYLHMLEAQGVDLNEIDKRHLKAVVDRKVERQSIRIPPLGTEQFLLHDVPVAENPQATQYTVRYKLYGLEDSKTYVRTGWVISRPDRSYWVRRLTYTKTGDAREFQIPASCVAEDGTMVVAFQNLQVSGPPGADGEAPKGVSVSFSVEEGLEVLAPVPSTLGGALASLTDAEPVANAAQTFPFLFNFVRGLVMVLIRLAFLTAVGVAATSCLHFPVALLVLVLTLFLGATNQFYVNLVEKQAATPAAQEELEFKPETVLQDSGTWVYRSALSPAFQVLARTLTTVFPDFGLTDPTPHLAIGREIGWGLLLRRVFWELIFRGGLVALVGLGIFYRRELARPEL